MPETYVDPRKYSVYCHTSKRNGKKYFGITINKPKVRWANGKGYSGQPFYNAIVKEGWDGFSHEVLYEGLDGNEVHEKERLLITLHKTENPEFGYNTRVFDMRHFESLTPTD